jgi:hypothetical protein
MKKSIAAIILVVIGLIMVPQIFTQDTSRLNELTKQMEQLSNDFQVGKITAQQFQQQALVIQEEMQAAAQSIRQETQRQVRSGEAENQRLSQTTPSFTDVEMREILDLRDRYNKVIVQFNEGRITEAEAARQTEPIQKEIDRIYAPYKNLENEMLYNIGIQQAELDEQLNNLWPGATLGWPPASGERNYLEVSGLSRPIRQAAGTRASYSSRRSSAFGPIIHYWIYQTGANQTAFDDLKRQIESITGQEMEKMPQSRASNGYRLFVLRKVDNDGTHWYYSHEIILENDGTITYGVDDTAHDEGPGSTRRD